MSTTNEEQLRTVEELKEMGILPETEDPKDYPPLATGQTWVSKRGVSYILGKRTARGWTVDVVDRKGVTGSSPDPWMFTDRQFRGLINEDGLRLYDPTASIDSLAQRLDRRGHRALAASLDKISREYFGEARKPQQVQRDRRNRANEQIVLLKEQIKDSDDPEQIIKLAEELDDAAKVIEEEGDTLAPFDDEITPVDPVSPPERISEPNLVSR